MCRLRNLLLLIALAGCAKAPYLKTAQASETLNGGLVGFSLELAGDGSCSVLVGIRDGSTGRTPVPKQWCVDAKRAKQTLANAPKPEPTKEQPKP